MTAHLELEDLSALLDGELEPVRAAEARRHLESCAACSGRFAGMERSVASLRGLPSAPPPPEILHRIRRHAATISPSPSLLERLGDWLHPPALRPAFAAAFSLVFAAVLAVYAMNAYYSRQASPVAAGSDQPLEAYLRSGVPPSPTGSPAASADEAKDKERLRSLGYVGGQEKVERQLAEEVRPAPEAAKKLAKQAPAPPARPFSQQPASAAAPAPSLAQDLGAETRAQSDQPALNAARRDAQEAAAASEATDAVATGEAEADAFGKPSADLEQGRSNEAPASAKREERAKSAVTSAEPNAPIALTAPAGEGARRTAERREAAGRTFTRIDGTWYENGVAQDARRRRVEAGSAAGRALLARLPELADLLRSGGAVVLRDRGKVVELKSSTPTPP